MRGRVATPILTATISLTAYGLALTCRCIPGDPCWPLPDDWTAFNSSIAGKLIPTTPVAAPCYAGPSYIPIKCANIQANWLDTSFRAQFPIGYSYPDSESCDLPSAAGNTSSCLTGNNPVYAVDVTSASDVVVAIMFAKQKNLWLAIKTTGHDMLGRSTGPGSLEIWLHNLRRGIAVEQVYTPTQVCLGPTGATTWAGAAISIYGGYSWSDVYTVARSANLIVVGGNCPSVSAIGGFLQGGGYSPATSLLGLAADQLLEAYVVLADGSYVVASLCQNPDLFKAIRGGGGGTFGVVTGAKIKAYPDVLTSSVIFTMSLLTADDASFFLDSLAYIYQYLPPLADAGLGGWAAWSLYGSASLGSNDNLYLSLVGIGLPLARVQALFDPIVTGLAPMNNTNLRLSVWYTPFNSYLDWYYALSNMNAPAGHGAITSRLLSSSHLSNTDALRYMLQISAGSPSEQTAMHTIVTGGPGVKASDPSSGVNPAWRTASLLHQVMRSWSSGANADEIQAVHHDITFVKGAGVEALAPDSGAYMNEGDVQDSNYLKSFYGDALSSHAAAKQKYDPDGVFYCPTCVGADQWVMDGQGRICKPSLLGL